MESAGPPATTTASSSPPLRPAEIPAVDMTTERQMAGLQSRARLRRHQERQLRQLPFLYHRVEDLQETCERLEHELAVSRQRVAVFQHETFALRSLIKFTERPELAAAAEKDAARCMLQEEVKELRRRVQQLQHDKEQCLRQSEQACETAEFYKQLCDELHMESLQAAETEDGGGLPSTPPHARVLPAGRTPSHGENSVLAASGSAASAVTPLSSSPPADTRARRLHGALEFERVRSAALEETVRLLQSALADANAAHSRPAALSTPTPGSVAALGDDETGLSSVAGESVTTADPSRRSAARLRQHVSILRSENRMLTQRVTEVVARNVRCVKDIAALKLANKRLQQQQQQ